MPDRHQITGYYGITGGMNIRQILADNLATLQASRKDLKSAPAIERATTERGPVSGYQKRQSSSSRKQARRSTWTTSIHWH